MPVVSGGEADVETKEEIHGLARAVLARMGLGGRRLDDAARDIERAFGYPTVSEGGVDRVPETAKALLEMLLEEARTKEKT